MILNYSNVYNFEGVAYYLAAGEKNAGLNLFNNKIEDVFKAKIIEPYKIKTQAINSASEVATMILRIDDVIASSGSKGKKIHPEMNEEF